MISLKCSACAKITVWDSLYVPTFLYPMKILEKIQLQIDGCNIHMQGDNVD